MILRDEEIGIGTTAKEQEVDAMVYKLYGLTHEEVKIVDSEFNLSRDEYDK